MLASMIVGYQGEKLQPAFIQGQGAGSVSEQCKRYGDIHVFPILQRDDKFKRYFEK